MLTMNFDARLPVLVVLVLFFAVAGCTKPPARQPGSQTAVVDRPDPTTPPNEFLVVSREVLTALFDGVARDAALSPTGEPDIGVNRTDDSVPLSAWATYPTKDEWVDLPSKTDAAGLTAGKGRVSLWLAARRDVEPPGFTPFVPPKGCFVQRAVWSAEGPAAKVVVYSMTGDAAAHDRLVAIVGEEL